MHEASCHRRLIYTLSRTWEGLICFIYLIFLFFLKGGGLICLIVKDSKKWWSWNLIPYQHSDRVRTAFCSFSCQKPPHIYAEILISWKGRKTTALAH